MKTTISPGPPRAGTVVPPRGTFYAGSARRASTWTPPGPGARPPAASAAEPGPAPEPLPAHREHLDPRQVGRGLRSQVGVAVVADAPDAGDGLPQVDVGLRLVADHRPQVVA